MPDLDFLSEAIRNWKYSCGAEIGKIHELGLVGEKRNRVPSPATCMSEHTNTRHIDCELKRQLSKKNLAKWQCYVATYV